MKIQWTWHAIFLFIPSLILAHDDNLPLATASEMSQWCKETSYSHLMQKADRLYNWTHSVVAKGNTYVVKGHWRVNDNDVYVECKARIGARREYATYRVVDEHDR